MGKKKTLIFLLIVPLLVALISFVSYIVLRRQVRVDIRDIDWAYDNTSETSFQIGRKYSLEAKPIYDTSLQLSDGNDLVWSIRDQDEGFAEIERSGDSFYLIPEKEGEIQLTCSNEKKTVSKRVKAYLYSSGIVTINPVTPLSNAAVEKTLKFGQFDFSYSAEGAAPTAVASSLKVNIYAVFDGDENPALTYSTSDNVVFDAQSSTLAFRGTGDAFLKVTPVNYPSKARQFDFKIVENGVNIRSYRDLLYATNWATSSYNLVLQTNLGSRKDVEELGLSNTEMFGNYNQATGKFSFASEIYTFRTTYFSEFIDQYNRYYKDSSDDYGQIDPTIKAGIHLKSDLYGNGFFINMSNLCYPNHGEIDKTTGKIKPGADDYFQGPLPFVGLGNLNTYPIISAYGQDNAGIYIDTDNITIDDVRLQNVDSVDNMYNLTYTGTLLDIEASGVTVRNSVLSNAKNIVRAFSADGLTIANCTLKNAAEFLLHLGSNRNNSYDTEKKFSYFDGTDTTQQDFSTFFDGKGDASLDGAYTKILKGDLNDTAAIEKSISSVQDGLDNPAGLVDGDGRVNYDAKVVVEDTNFYDSGLYSIALDSAFNGGYLYNGSPSLVRETFQRFNVDLLPPDKVGHTSFPVQLTLKGDTRFYDFKRVDALDLSTLIEENVTTMLKQFGMIDAGVNIDIDSYFPLKDELQKQAEANGTLYTKVEDGEKHGYLNTQVVWYGGGVNLSEVIDERESKDSSSSYDLDFVSEALNYKRDPSLGSTVTALIQVLRRAVFMVTGTHPFKTVTNAKVETGEVPPYFDEVPPDLSER